MIFSANFLRVNMSRTFGDSPVNRKVYQDVTNYKYLITERIHRDCRCHDDRQYLLLLTYCSERPGSVRSAQLNLILVLCSRTTSDFAMGTPATAYGMTI
ncbi:hypothetical protein J6590_011734 [Homalodisca vitripennis]|nr:hypothetical protein J6590_011734 [Homalodisca vitripennis]